MSTDDRTFVTGPQDKPFSAQGSTVLRPDGSDRESPQWEDRPIREDPWSPSDEVTISRRDDTATRLVSRLAGLTARHSFLVGQLELLRVQMYREGPEVRRFADLLGQAIQDARRFEGDEAHDQSEAETRPAAMVGR